VGITAALALEALILLLLLTLGQSHGRRQESGPALTTFDARPEAQAEEQAIERSAEEESPAPAEAVEEAVTEPEAVPSPPPTPASQPQPQPSRPAFIPLDRNQMARADIAPPPRAAPPPVQGPVQGPPAGPQDRGAGDDTQVVGTAPDGEPLYAAAWYRKPYDDELSGYLSTATGPGWGLIACKTAPEWRVEDCVALSESPRGSNIARSVLAAAWQFRVRPPRVGGQSLVGSWVRIRIDYDMRPR
jgi:protein TonB